jgi:ribosomal protein L12E/L44/L45/RPP1/RPP2
MKTARNSLEEHVQALAVKFAQDVLAALKGASLSDIASLAGSSPALSTTAAQPRAAARAPAKRARRSAEDLDRTVERLVRALEKAPDGLRAEALRVELGLAAKDMPRPLSLALESKRIKKRGQKRATTYFAAK